MFLHFSSCVCRSSHFVYLHYYVPLLRICFHCLFSVNQNESLLWKRVWEWLLLVFWFLWSHGEMCTSIWASPKEWSWVSEPHLSQRLCLSPFLSTFLISLFSCLVFLLLHLLCLPIIRLQHTHTHSLQRCIVKPPIGERCAVGEELVMILSPPFRGPAVNMHVFTVT